MSISSLSPQTVPGCHGAGAGAEPGAGAGAGALLPRKPLASLYSPAGICRRVLSASSSVLQGKKGGGCWGVGGWVGVCTTVRAELLPVPPTPVVQVN